MRGRAFFVVGVTVASLFAGCVGSVADPLGETNAPTAASEGRQEGKKLPAHVTGVIIDTELLPIADAEIVVTPGDHLVLTGPDGTFAVGPLEPGEYVVVAQKQGYASKEKQVQVTETDEAFVRLTLEPVASDVPYHETYTESMYLICHVVLASNTGGFTLLNAPCGAVDLVAGSTNTLDHWIFFFTIDKPGFKSLLMEMTWNTQQFGHDGLMQLSTLGRVAPNGGAGVTVEGSVYGETMGPPFHDVIHAGVGYWEPDPESIFYPEPNATEQFKMLIAGGGGNTTLDGSAFFVEFRPTAYLTFFFNRQASPDFSILPPE